MREHQKDTRSIKLVQQTFVVDIFYWTTPHCDTKCVSGSHRQKNPWTFIIFCDAFIGWHQFIYICFFITKKLFRDCITMALRKKLKINIFITGFYTMQTQPSPSCTLIIPSHSKYIIYVGRQIGTRPVLALEPILTPILEQNQNKFYWNAIDFECLFGWITSK